MIIGAYQPHLSFNPATANNNANSENFAQNQDNFAASENNENSKNSTQNSQNSQDSQNSQKNGSKNALGLSEAEQRQVSELAATDAHVRAHEAAHMGAGGGLTTPASYTYERGPDNKMYAVAGEVGISTGEGKTPQETLAKAQQIRRAALAPSDPSPQDLKVAARATSMEMAARAQIMAQKMEEQKQNSPNNSNNSNSADNANNAGIPNNSNGIPNSQNSIKDKAIKAYTSSFNDFSAGFVA